MKTLLFALFFISTVNLDAQDIYIAGKVTKGETAAYYCYKKDKFCTKIRNVNNIDTTNTEYYLDGTIVPKYDEDLDANYGHSQEDLQRVFREVLTDEEWKKIKGKIGYTLIFSIVADSTGRTKELNFIFRTDDPVLSKFLPDRLYQLEMKFKEIIKLIYRPNAKRLRNAKYSQSISYRDLK